MLRAFLIATAAVTCINHALAAKPNIVLVMTDDQGWGQTGYYNHPHLKTPNLDEMAANGLRMDRFYAGASNCSPTRSTVLTGRSNDRCGVHNHGFPLRSQEKTVAQAVKQAGYATAHFGKWHLNGLRGPGVPILKGDTHDPAAFGFDTWVSVTNFFDLDPVMSNRGEIEQKQGDSSEITVDLALNFIRKQSAESKPFFVVIWCGSPHSPMRALDKDRAAFADLPIKTQHHLGELVAVDRSLGTLRKGLRDAGVAENTLVWFNSDNGGLKGYGPETTGGLRGWKNTMYEGGLRVPCVIEWPAVINKPRISRHPSGTVDIFPTIAEIVGLPESSLLKPIDGRSLRAVFDQEPTSRKDPLFFRHQDRSVVIDNDIKMISQDNKFELYDLSKDKKEQNDLVKQKPRLAKELQAQLVAWNQSLDNSVAGNDYPEGHVLPQPERRMWREDPAYQPYVEKWAK